MQKRLIHNLLINIKRRSKKSRKTKKMLQTIMHTLKKVITKRKIPRLTKPITAKRTKHTPIQTRQKTMTKTTRIQQPALAQTQLRMATQIPQVQVKIRMPIRAMLRVLLRL